MMLPSLLVMLSFALPQSSDSLGTYLLESGQQIRGRIAAIEGKEVKLKVPIGGGHYLQRIAFDRFTAPSRYRIRRALSRDDSAQDHVELAKFAVEVGLPAVAKRELGRARELAKNHDLAPELDAAIAESGAELLLKLAGQMLDKGRLTQARRYVSLIFVRYPDSRVASRKDALLKILDDASERIAAGRAAEKKRHADSVRAKKRDKLIASVEKHVRSGIDANRKGLLASKSVSRAKALFLRALRHYDRARLTASRELRKNANDRDLQEALGDVVARADSSSIEALLNVASLSTIRGSFNQALGYVNRILASDPRNRDALDMRARIEIAANQPIYY